MARRTAKRKRPTGDDHVLTFARKKTKTALDNAITPRVTRSMTTDAARQAVFKTAELLEHIFEHLPQKDILVAQGACRQFRDIADTSPSLQVMIFRRASKAPHEQRAIKDRGRHNFFRPAIACDVTSKTFDVTELNTMLLRQTSFSSSSHAAYVEEDRDSLSESHLRIQTSLQPNCFKANRLPGSTFGDRTQITVLRIVTDDQGITFSTLMKHILDDTDGPFWGTGALISEFCEGSGAKVWSTGAKPLHDVLQDLEEKYEEQAQVSPSSCITTLRGVVAPSEKEREEVKDWKAQQG